MRPKLYVLLQEMTKLSEINAARLGLSELRKGYSVGADMFALRITDTLSKLLKILAMTTLSKALPNFKKLCMTTVKDQKVSMSRKCHNHTPQTNPWHREEEAPKTNSHTTAGT